jgi:hypothetical protein
MLYEKKNCEPVMQKTTTKQQQQQKSTTTQQRKKPKKLQHNKQKNIDTKPHGQGACHNKYNTVGKT